MDTGLKAIHPLTKQEVPVWVANFVLMSYGTGAVMAVPAHDERDWEFAQSHNIPVHPVISPDRSEERRVGKERRYRCRLRDQKDERMWTRMHHLHDEHQLPSLAAR